MSPIRKPVAISDLYTAVLALATAVVFATAVFVAIKCQVDYSAIFKITDLAR